MNAGEKLDPRALVAGKGNPGRATPGPEVWQGGLFDKGSWCEAQAGWARSVITGRYAAQGFASCTFGRRCACHEL